MSARIYGLVDPNTHLVRYIGKAVSKNRPSEHRRLRLTHGRSCDAWIRELLAAGHDYEVVVLELVEDPSAPSSRCPWWTGINATAINDAERWWIAFGRACGWPLTNESAGGAGSSRPHTPEARLKMSAARSGRPLSEAHRIAIGNGVRGRKVSAETRQKMSLNNPMRRPEIAAKVSRALLGHVVTVKTRALVAESNRRRARKDPNGQA